MGAEMEIDAVSDTQTVIGALLTILSPVIGLAILADSLIGNHEVRPMIGYVKNDLNLKLTDEQCELIFESLKFLIGYPALLHFLKHGFFSVQ
jgi:hypothetical protein